MPQLAILNFLLGFGAIFAAAAGGLFLSVDAANAFLHDRSILDSWLYTLSVSAHGHTNLFGLLHIAFGLTMPYSPLGGWVKKAQTLGFGLGTLAMSVLMLLRAYGGPQTSFDVLGLAIGLCLSATMAALASHCYGLARKLVR